MKTSQAPDRWVSKGLRISKSFHHKDLYLIDIIGTNQGYNINTSEESMLEMHPPDQEVETKKAA